MMSTIRQSLLRLLATFRSNRAEDDLAREMHAHLALLEDKYIADGMTADEARLAARRAFGGVEQAKEHHRDARAFRWIDDLQRDLAYAVRSLRRAPSFTVAAVVTLGVGVGATTTIFSVAERVLLRPLSFPRGEQLVRVQLVDQRGVRSLNYAEYRAWQTRTTTLAGLAASATDPRVLLQVPDGMARLAGGFVSLNYFEVLGVDAALGRTIRSSDASAPDVVVLTDSAWRRVFRGDPGVLGTPIEFRSGMAGRVVTVIGVLPPDLPQIGMPLDFYTPLVDAPDGRPPTVGLIGRLADGVSIAAATDEANTIGPAVRPLPADFRMPESGRAYQVVALSESAAAELRPVIRVLLWAVGVVLLIVCANVASLLLARGSSRHREIAMRLVLGASRNRIARQLVAECLVIAGAGAAVGFSLAVVGITLLRELAAVGAPGIFRLAYGVSVVPRADEIRVDAAMLVGSLGISAVAAILYAALPSWHLTRGALADRIGTRGAVGSASGTRLRSLLVAWQVAAATTLLVTAGLLARSFVTLVNVDTGYDVRNALGFQLVLPDTYSAERKVDTITRLLDRLRALPGVRAAGFSYSGVLLGVEDTIGTLVPPGRSLEEMRVDSSGMALEQPGGDQRPRIRSVSPGFFAALGIRVVSGRDFTATDDAAAPLVVALDRTTARHCFGDVNPVGSRLDWYPSSGAPVSLTVIAVVDDVRQGSPSTTARPQFYLDLRQLLTVGRRFGLPPNQLDTLVFGFYSFTVRTAAAPAAIIPAVERTIREVDALAGIDAILPLDDLFAASLARRRFNAVMVGVFASVASLLAAVGVYGLLTYSVVQRTQEIGVRMALGATRRQVLALVMRRGVALAAFGIAVGLAGAAAGARYLQSLLYGIEPTDPVTFASAAALFALVALAAAWLPAHRATRVDPMVALRME
jgi:putative ABC transport system permease protein